MFAYYLLVACLLLASVTVLCAAGHHQVWPDQRKVASVGTASFLSVLASKRLLMTAYLITQ